MARGSNKIIFVFLTFLTACFLDFSIVPGKTGLAFAGDILAKGTKLYSQFNEELIIRDFFNDRKGGIFVDIGCYHYQTYSTTYYLEKHLGWSGIAVDALAEVALGYIENRPRTRFFSFIVTDHSFDIEPFYRLMDRPLSSANPAYAQEHAKAFNDGAGYQTIYVMSITLNDLLEKNGISKIDLLSMDIEDGEKKALEGFDIERFRPELVCIESNHHDHTEYFKRHNYELIEEYKKYDQVNNYYRPKMNTKK